jgi:hypothetical protein
MFKNLRAGENFHIVLWLIKDLCWVMDWRTAGVIMFVPTVVMAAYIAWRFRREIGEFLHSLAVVFWICANGVWMLGEFHCDDCTRPQATVFFVLGLLCVAWYYLRVRPFWSRSKEVVRQKGM